MLIFLDIMHPSKIIGININMNSFSWKSMLYIYFKITSSNYHLEKILVLLSAILAVRSVLWESTIKNSSTHGTDSKHLAKLASSFLQGTNKLSGTLVPRVIEKLILNGVFFNWALRMPCKKVCGFRINGKDDDQHPSNDSQARAREKEQCATSVGKIQWSSAVLLRLRYFFHLARLQLHALPHQSLLNLESCRLWRLNQWSPSSL